MIFIPYVTVKVPVRLLTYLDLSPVFLLHREPPHPVTSSLLVPRVLETPGLCFLSVLSHGLLRGAGGLWAVSSLSSDLTCSRLLELFSSAVASSYWLFLSGFLFKKQNLS